ncbi:hypothetical protein [Anaerovorax odorimutans]|uniref:hypothetical protein n=1 Tax=Anaerovorax odorimutans TaxID=109327 RepID=UPI000427AB74|nr:hypothetical protein [Anaerovorax odorimutans]
MQNFDVLKKKPTQAKQGMTPWPYCDVAPVKTLEDAMEYKMLYPEIFYKLQPFVLEVCDQIDTYGGTVLNQEMVQNLSDKISVNALKMHPELNEYVAQSKTVVNQKDTNINAQQDNWFDDGCYGDGCYGGGYYGGGRYPGRNQNLFRSLIDILLLNELFRRRRRYY